MAYAGRMKSVSVSKLGKKFVKSSSERVASLEAQLKAKNKELKEYKARIVELEEENSELRILLAETDLDESAVLIRPDGGDNYKASEEEMQHPLGDEGKKYKTNLEQNRGLLESRYFCYKSSDYNGNCLFEAQRFGEVGTE